MNLLRSLKIRQKLTMLLLFIGLIPTLAVSTLAYVTISNQLAHKTEDQLTSLAVRQGQKINGLLQDRQEQVLKLANRYDLQSSINVYLSGGAKDSGPIGTVLRERKTEMGDVKDIYLSDPEGRIMASTVSGLSMQKIAASDYAAKAGQQNSVTVRDDLRDGIRRLYIATKMSVNQKEIGTLTLVFGLDDIVATLNDYTGLGATGETLLTATDQDNHTVSLFPLRFNNKSLVQVNSLQLGTHADMTYSDVNDYRGHPAVVSAQAIASADWMLATKIDYAEAYAPIADLRNALVGIVLGSSIIIVLVALLFTRFFTAPIIALTEKTRGIIQGNFNQRIVVNSKDEVGTLAAAFNTMTDELAKSYQALEKKVEERTQALNQKLHELSDANAKDEAILSSMGEGMIVTDSAGNVLILNELASDLLAVDAADVVGKPLAAKLMCEKSDELIPPPEQPTEVALRTGQKTVQQVRVQGKDEKVRVLGVTATPVLQQASVIGAIQILRDVTKEKEIDRMKTEFISLASHQLRTPLSAIRWFTEMLLRGDAGKLNDEQQEFAQNVSDSTDRMIALVSSLLNISRIESGRIRIDPVPTDLGELVSGIVNDLKGKTEERDQTIVVSVHRELPKVNLDSRLMGQVYINLLTNAIKYSPKGCDIALFVSRKGDELVSQISDNGYGIPKPEQSKMFQKFFRASNVSKIETDGTGLGMYLVKAIVESSGGKIWFESTEGQGTTFWFSIPMSGMQAKEGEVTID